MTVQATNYDGSKTYNLTEEADLTKKLNTVTKLYYVSKVIQIPSTESVVDLYTQDELKSLLGVTSDTNFNNKITAFAINGAKSTNSANVVSINYVERDKKMQIKVNTASVGSMRANIVIAFSEQG